MIDELLTIEQVAAILCVSRNHLYNLRADGKGIKCHRRGRRIYYSSNDVAAYLSSERARTTRGSGTR
jgi:hypothetical protein